MFCPVCRAEYRQGFTRCADCDVELVYELEPQGDVAATSELDGREGELRLIWKGHDQATCVLLCRDLMNADISYKVAQISESRSTNMRVSWRYEIGVIASDYERAKQLLGIEGDFEEVRDSLDDLAQEDENDEAESVPPDDSPPDAQVRNDSYLNPWYPEDATVEIWSQSDEDLSGGIQMALKENLIHCRLDGQEGIRKVFVMPQDEGRAREIVREVTEGLLP